MHELIFDVPRFAKNHATLGLLSEEEGESLHNSVNQELRQLHGVRDEKQKLRLLLTRQELWGKADRKLQQAKVRKCVKCSTPKQRVFYREGKCYVCGGLRRT